MIAVCGSAKTDQTWPSSTMRPASMTATRSAIAAHHFHLVGDEQDGQAELAVDVLQQRQDRARRLGIERRGRFVGQQQRRAGGKRPGDADALLLAAGERRRIGLRLVGETDEIEQFARARFRRSALATPSIFSGRATLSSTVLAESRLKCWKIMPMRRRSGCSSFSDKPVILRPSIWISPLSARSSPFRQRISVDLPAPLRPMMPRISPLRTVSEMPSSAGVVAEPALDVDQPDDLVALDAPGGCP